MNEQLNFTSGRNLSSSNALSWTSCSTYYNSASAQDTEFEFEQDQENTCSGTAECTNEGIIDF